jgi:hypothetical protein
VIARRKFSTTDLTNMSAEVYDLRMCY